MYYVSWVLRAEGLPSSLREFARYLRKRYGGILPGTADRAKWTRLLEEHRYRTYMKATSQEGAFLYMAAAFVII